MVKLRGINVWPEACGKIVSEDSRTNGEYYCYVEKVIQDGKPAKDEMTILVEKRSVDQHDESLKQDLEEILKRKIGVKIHVQIVDTDSLMELTGHGHRAKLKRFEDRRKEGMGV
nr:hypothetical protein [Fictibacillus nanhaiensis]